jgi:hypothetical protein
MKLMSDLSLPTSIDERRVHESGYSILSCCGCKIQCEGLFDRGMVVMMKRLRMNESCISDGRQLSIGLVLRGDRERCRR